MNDKFQLLNLYLTSSNPSRKTNPESVWDISQLKHLGFDRERGDRYENKWSVSQIQESTFVFCFIYIHTHTLLKNLKN